MYGRGGCAQALEQPSHTLVTWSIVRHSGRVQTMHGRRRTAALYQAGGRAAIVSGSRRAAGALPGGIPRHGVATVHVHTASHRGAVRGIPSIAWPAQVIVIVSSERFLRAAAVGDVEHVVNVP